MQSKEGGYYCALDADSEGEEGKYYVWDKNDIAKILDEDTYKLFAHQYGLEESANFEGSWHICLRNTTEQTAEKFSITLEQCEKKLTQAKTILFAQREQRVRPGLDDKVLGSWNGLMIKGMADAARIFDQERYLESANNALEFIINTLWQNNRLKASYKDGQTHLNAYLDDYAFLLQASLSLLQAKWNSEHLNFAVALANSLLEHFYDNDQGGFYFTSHDHEQLIQRSKPFMDNATPSGNGIACLALMQLSYLTGDTRYLDAAEKTLKLAWPLIQRAPYACITLLHAVEEYLDPSATIVIRGKANDIQNWRSTTMQLGYQGLSQVYAIPNSCNDLPDLLSEKRSIDGTTAYLCQGMSCQAPITELEKLLMSLKILEFE